MRVTHAINSIYKLISFFEIIEDNGLIDSWETARVCAMGGAGVVFGRHGIPYRRKRRFASTEDEEGQS